MTGRNLVAGDYSSRLSPYLTSGILSARMVCNEAKMIGKGGKLESGRDTGIGMWVQEVSLLSSPPGSEGSDLMTGVVARFLQPRHGYLATSINGQAVPREVRRCTMGSQRGSPSALERRQDGIPYRRRRHAVMQSKGYVDRMSALGVML